jgi:hypothetical protein
LLLVWLSGGGQMTDAKWFIRGVPPDVVEMVNAAAKARGQTVGRVVADALRLGLPLIDGGQTPVTQAAPPDALADVIRRLEAIERRLDGQVTDERVTRRAVTDKTDTRQTRRAVNQTDLEDLLRPPPPSPAPPAEIQDPEIEENAVGITNSVSEPPAEDGNQGCNATLTSDPAPEQPKELTPFAAALSSAIKASGKSLREVAEMMAEKGCAVSSAAIGQWARGVTKPTPEKRAILCELFPSLKDIEP